MHIFVIFIVNRNWNKNTGTLQTSKKYWQLDILLGQMGSIRLLIPENQICGVLQKMSLEVPRVQ